MSLLTLTAGGAEVRISTLGAEWRGWTVDGRPLLWKGDPAVWPETAPVLFPVVGWTRGGVVRLGREQFPLGVHGFARRLPFAVVSAASDQLVLRLEDTAETRAVFPFRFALNLSYRLEPDALHVAVEVASVGDRLPYACGLHPGFAWPFAGGSLADYRLVFDEVEETSVPIITADGLFSSARRQLPFDGKTLPLDSALFAHEALCFLNLRSRGVSFMHADGPMIRVETRDFPHLALWSRGGGAFLAIEAWTGHGDPEGFDGDLFAKPSMRMLDPGARACHEVTYRYSRG